MTYQQTLEWMFAQLPMYQQKGPSALNPKLKNIQDFCAYLDHPERKFRSIHVAGTNGKGSSCHMLASVLQEAGHQVGLYTSPHLRDFRERIKINGKVASQAFVTSFIKNHKSFLEQHRLSFFEMTVGMAFDYFAKKKIDIAVVEVGLGGRLDSTNIITPEVCLITNIGYDHMQILGNTLEKIAMEKAGIIKRGIPVVVSETQSVTKGIFEMVAAKRDSRIIFADQQDTDYYDTDLLGKYQQQNINGVAAVLKQLKAFKITKGQLKKGLKNVVANTGLLGRWQVLQRNPLIVCDTAHNQEAIQLVIQQIMQCKYENLHMVLGFVDDKDLDAVLPLFPKDAIYYFVKPKIPRGIDADTLKERAAVHGLNGKAVKTVSEGFSRAKKNAQKEDFIFVGGSTFVAADVV